jgi:hypothetical protein
MQISQVWQVFWQFVSTVQVWHFVGSLMSAIEQVLLRRTDFEPPPGSGTAQQPKQSQPFGVSFPQKSMQRWDWVFGQFL